ncbi:hypothetical protein [Pseudomonas sp. Gutcm_11s]|uniref:hypothetical protein n=1 Tax=Pseudomonas sp. Gutcm_11s TaxID=3026088 RepID=UPI002360612E|nr:hypothetical protein [Pseudomonas sp. Gutcm_11s]MDD0842798.1 hypothetical protein [Pseudomonas sp. Gutcm_11s]
MRSMILLSVLLSGLAMAGEPARQPIPIEYVSPGASGSVSSSSRSQSYDVYGGHAVPGQGYGREVQIQGGSSVRQSGGIRQSIEYPSGIEVQRYPGSSDYEIQRNR